MEFTLSPSDLSALANYVGYEVGDAENPIPVPASPEGVAAFLLDHSNAIVSDLWGKVMASVSEGNVVGLNYDENWNNKVECLYREGALAYTD